MRVAGNLPQGCGKGEYGHASVSSLTPRAQPPLNAPKAGVLVCPAAHDLVGGQEFRVDGLVGDVCEFLCYALALVTTRNRHTVKV